MKRTANKRWLKIGFILGMMVLLVTQIRPLEIKAAQPKLNTDKKTILIGNTYKLKVKNSSKKVTWSSSNPKVATVSSAGIVSAKKAGTAVITAKVGKKKLTCKVTVAKAQDLYVNKTIRLLNKERRKYGYASFDKNYYLQLAAKRRAKELSKKFSHTRPNGNKWTSAIDMKYDFKYAAENIACDFATPQQTVKAWMTNADTKSKIISKKYNEIGIGVYLGEDGYLYWCAIFAKEK